MSTDPRELILFQEVSKFYGEVLGINRVSLSIPPGITSLVGPNGSGKSTLMNLMTGLLHPTVGRISVRGTATDDPERLHRLVGYCAQPDTFPPAITGLAFVAGFLEICGLGRRAAQLRAEETIDQLGLSDAAGRKVAAYSKGMRQRIKLARAIAHDPPVLVLDEPLNGLDPMARAEVIALFRRWGAGGRHLIVSSHILHEVDLLSDQVILMNQGYVVAEGDIQGVRGEMTRHPLQIVVRCADPRPLAARLIGADSVTDLQLHADGGGFFARTRDPEGFYRLVQDAVLQEGLILETVMPVDDDVGAVYQYLIGEA